MKLKKCIQNNFSVDLMQYNRTETQFQHNQGQLVLYNKRVLAIAGLISNEFAAGGAAVEELNDEQTEWSMHQMSPVNDLKRLWDFTALTSGSKLLVFGQFTYDEFYK